MHKHGECSAKFCWHVRPFAGRLSDGEVIPGPVGWFLRTHLAQCASCRRALEAILALKDRLRALRTASVESPSSETLEGERWSVLEQAWAETEKKRQER